MTPDSPLLPRGPLRWLSTRIGARLWLGFGLLCLLMIAVAANSIWQSRQMHLQFNAMMDDSVPQLAQLQSLAHEVSQVNLAARDALLAADASAAAAALQRIEGGRSRIGEQIQKLQDLLKDSDERARKGAEELATHSSGILVALVKFSRLHKAGQIDGARTLLGSMLQPKLDQLASAIAASQTIEMTHLEEARHAVAASSRVSATITGGLLLVALGLSALLAWRITHSVTGPVAVAVAQAERIASGDLASVTHIDRHDEIGRLQQAMVRMQGELAELVGRIRLTANEMAIASGEIANGSQDLSRRTEQTASSLQQTASTMEELAGTVRQSARSAQDANELAGQTARAAHTGGDVVSRVVASMAEIDASSRRIHEITGVIDGIAFQTNILALNAAVEAARAGDHGRGFAVVAAEVRSLAQRAATAAREIKGLIDSSTASVDSGSRLVREAGGAMDEIVSGVQRVTEIINGISVAASEQSSGLGMVTGSVSDLDTMTQSNAALVEQSAAAAESLREQSHGLQQLVNRFKLA